MIRVARPTAAECGKAGRHAYERARGKQQGLEPAHGAWAWGGAGLASGCQPRASSSQDSRVEQDDGGLVREGEQLAQQPLKGPPDQVVEPGLLLLG